MKQLGLLFLVLLLSLSQLLAQTSACPEKFKAYNSQGQETTVFCVGERIKFKSCVAGVKADQEYYEYDNIITFPDTVKYHTYNQPGIYTVTQLITDGNPPPAILPNRTFTVVERPVPNFDLTACGLRTVLVSIPNQTYDKYSIDYKDGTVIEINKGATIPPHPYASQQSTYTVLVTGKYNTSNCINEKINTINALPSAQTPALQNIKLDASGNTGTLTLTNAQPEYIYIIEKQTGSGFTYVDSVKLPPSTTYNYQLKNINPPLSECFRIRMTDKCSSSLFVSNTICTVPLTTSTGDNLINLSWPVYSGSPKPVVYEIYKDGQLYKNEQGTSFTDIDIKCGQKYCYEVVALFNQASSIKSTSNQSCQTGTSTQIPAAGYLSSTFTTDNKINLTFKAPDKETVREITYLKNSNNNASTLSTTVQNRVTDNFTGGNICYQATFQNECNQTSSATNSTCPIILAASLADNNVVNINWSDYVGFINGTTQYFLEELDAAKNIKKSTVVTGNNFSASIPVGEQQLYFRIKAIASTNEITYSNNVLVNQESMLVIPTAFTPNGDNLNDRFEVKGKFIKELKMIIYNRWGQVVFQSHSQQNGWDGRIYGKEAPLGVYSYSVTGLAQDGKQLNKTGTVTLLR